ncbi:hypothetical protein [Marinomonas transparens]|uniref:Uncharacterized protein n=1 Tax=Marinomonas transparens TaxID=2795388 RepID=A0A934JSJ4_9GAMM|nr:hypothetical protein [Marinomonas transparens]MBJ7539953.1 hypothetical protein [Marinomonas transparens]
MFIYLDLNIISSIATGDLILEALPNDEFVFSKLHIQEILRSNDPYKYIDVLEQIDAKYLVPVLSGNPLLISHCVISTEYILPSIVYEEERQRPMVPHSYYDALAWSNGYEDEGELDRFSSDLVRSAREAIEKINFNKELKENFLKCVDIAEAKVDERIQKIKYLGNDNEAYRKMIGSFRGALNNLQSPVIFNIWGHLNKEKIGDNTPEEFFGFQRAPYEIYGIIMCCGVFDKIGYQAEAKKIKSSDKQPNVQSDAYHIAFASYCDKFISLDKKSIHRAKAIYEFRRIKTEAILLKIN